MINLFKNPFKANTKDKFDANSLNDKPFNAKLKKISHILQLTDGIKQIYRYDYQTNEEREEILLKIKERKKLVFDELKNDSLYFNFGDNIFLKREFEALYIEDCDS